MNIIENQRVILQMLQMFLNRMQKFSRPRMLVAYLRAEIKTPDDLRRYNTHVHISVCLLHKRINVYQ